MNFPRRQRRLGWSVVEAERLVLGRPVPGDVPALFRVTSDPQAWRHFPCGRHSTPAQTESAVRAWMSGWDARGLDTWTVRLRTTCQLIGYGGVNLLEQGFWNLGYRLAPAAHGRGYATDVARAGLAAAHAHTPEVPVIARVLSNNPASMRVAEKAGLEKVAVGAPKPGHALGVDLVVYADRVLDAGQVDAALALG